ncbi:hypothetical protein [Nocardia sp. No.11]|uniref:hypothetical protein n=1 Tax=Nocardia sp. No.11 TaxID=3128861 RepID=UPI00319EB558
MKVGEWLLQLVGDDPVDVEVEAFEERPVEVASYLIGAGSVQIPRIGQEVEPSFEDLHPNSEFSVRRGETGFDSRPIGVNLPQAIFDLGLWQRAVGGQVEQSLFLGVEVFELLGHTAVHLTDAGLFVCHDLAEELTRRRLEPLWDAERPVVLDDGIFDAISGEVRQIAHAFLATPAQEVAVPLAIAPTSFGVDESRGPAVASTATTDRSPSR